MSKFLCKIFGWHQYKSGSLITIITGNYYLHQDYCCICGKETRFWFHESAYEDVMKKEQANE